MQALRERALHFGDYWRKMRETAIETDAVVVGLGILGLLIARRLSAFGQRVVLIDSSQTIAHGASIKNHGWLHTGIVHSLSVSDPQIARTIVQKLQYGHTFFCNYAPECLVDPFIPTYAITRDNALAQRARENWTAFGVPFQEVSQTAFSQIQPTLRFAQTSTVFENGDVRVHNRLLFQKIFTDIRERGGVPLLGAQFDYTDHNTIQVRTAHSRYKVKSPLFFYATGPSLSDSHAKLTGNPLVTQFWKSHLLFYPRFTNVSCVSLDRNAPIVINHDDVSIVNQSYDEVIVPGPDTVVDREAVQTAHSILADHYPHMKAAQPTSAIACIKPDFSHTFSGRHSVGGTLFEPIPGHFFATPGKMTEAPFVADQMVQRAGSYLNLELVTQRPIDLISSS